MRPRNYPDDGAGVPVNLARRALKIRGFLLKSETLPVVGRLEPYYNFFDVANFRVPSHRIYYPAQGMTHVYSSFCSKF
jgi:hypothetical protein